MALKDPRFTGAFTAVTTPFTADGRSIDFDRLKAQLEFQAAGGVKGIVVAGTTGESPTLEEAEYRALLDRCVELGRRLKLLVIAGTGSNSTAHAVGLQRHALSAGADGTLSVNPYYNKPTQDGLLRHFSAVAEAARIPVILYNIPGRSGVALTPATIEKLNGLPNIVAVKEATGSTDSASDILMRCPGLALLSGDDSMTLPFAAVGGVGVVSVVSNLAPAKVSALCAAFLAGRWAEALTLHRALFDLCRAMFLETNPIPIKAAMKLLGRDSGALRLPMCDAAPATVEAVAQALTRAGLR